MISSLCLASSAYCLIVARTVPSLEYLKGTTRIASMIFRVDHVFLVVSKGCADCVKIFRLKFVNWLIDSYVICRIYPLPATKFTSPWRSPWEANSFSASREFPTFYGSLRLNTGFTKARHLSVSWTRSFHSKPLPPPLLPPRYVPCVEETADKGWAPPCGFEDRLATYLKKSHEME